MDCQVADCRVILGNLLVRVTQNHKLLEDGGRVGLLQMAREGGKEIVKSGRERL